MKILAICGSPHKGNSYSILQTIKENYPSVDFKIMMIKDMNLEQCRGCYSCCLRGEDKCPLKDDRDMIIRDMQEADGVLFATPVFVNHISYLMKHFIDRLGFFAHRPAFFGKYAMVMSVCSGFGADKANDYMSGIFSVFGFAVVSALELKVAARTETENAYNHAQTINAFNTFLERINKDQGKMPTPTLLQLIYFNIFRSLSMITQKTNKADYEFYRDKKDFIYHIEINWLKNIVAKWIARKEVKKIMMNR
jgi:multimeric flavodoxin WrbA